MQGTGATLAMFASGRGALAGVRVDEESRVTLTDYGTAGHTAVTRWPKVPRAAAHQQPRASWRRR
jgi:hypothetical protein